MSQPENAEPATTAAPLARLAGLPPAEQERVLLGVVHEQVVAVLKAALPDAPDRVAPERPFKELGFDSLAAVDLHRRLCAATGLELPVTLVFDHPTPLAVARLARRLALGERAVPVVREPVARRERDDEPIAIVGIGCRYPGGSDTPEKLWDVVAGGRHVISDFPDDRGWDLDALFDPEPGKSGKSYVRKGGFLAEAAEFDAAFFGISPREALAMDPQQRLVLETAWEALEHAGVDPLSLRGSRTGVYIGVEPQEYGPRLHQAPEGLDGYLLTGNAPSVVSGRLAYSLGLEGPTVSIDTACSGSLVALHLAVRALRDGDCTTALAGGVAVMVHPGAFTAFSTQRGLAPDGVCKPFAAAADGTGWAEGVGVVVLERLSDALRAGHRVLGVVKGTAVNQDGASNGLTAPSGPAQQRVIRQALADAGLSTSDVDTVEAHGTGTRLGDPIEAQALLATYGQDRETPLWLGSIKSNIGHSQAAAGVAGLIKVVYAMRERVLPRTLHVDAPSPHVDWSAGDIELLTEQRPWDSPDRPRRAGISSFGVSGTNAHVVIEEPPAVEPVAPAKPAKATRKSKKAKATAPVPVPLVLSGRGEAALRGQAARLAGFLTGDAAPDLVDTAHELALRRAALEHRAVLHATDRADALRGLAALAAGQDAPGLVRGSATAGPTAFLFTGQGSQRLSAGRELYRAHPVFAKALDAACGWLDLQLDRPLGEVMFAEPGTEAAALLHRTAYAQSALFALETALYRLVESWGLRPDYVAGHSLGGITAAHVAGVLSLEDAALLVGARGRLMQALPEGGAMVSVRAPESDVLPLLEGREAEVRVAAVNGPAATVISGVETAVLEIAQVLADRGVKTKRLTVSHAFHSPLMEPALADFRRVAEVMTYSAPAIPVVSDVTGELATAEQLRSPEYWVDHVRQAVRFRDVVAELAARGVATFLELGPDAVLTAMAQDCVAEIEDTDFAFAALLRRDRDEVAEVRSAVALAHTRGQAVRWAELLPQGSGARVDLPRYAFQRERYWLTGGSSSGGAVELGQLAADHPLVGAVVGLAGGDRVVLTGRVSPRTHPWLADHVISGSVLLPGTAFVELAVRAGDEVGCGVLEELTLEAPLVLPERGGVVLQVVVDAPDDGGRRTVAVHSRPEHAPEDAGWTRHAGGVLSAQAPEPGERLETWPPRDAEPVDASTAYADLAALGYGYGPVFQGLRKAWRRGTGPSAEVYAEVALPESVAASAASFGLHPALLDAALHAVDVAGTAPGDPGEVRVPFAWNDVVLHATGASAVRVRISPAGSDAVSLTITDPAGAPVATVGSFVSRAVTAEQLAAARREHHESLLRQEWVSRPVPSGPVRPATVLGAGHADLAALGAALSSGATVPETVVHHVPTSTGDVLADVRAALDSVLTVVRQWLADERFGPSRLVVVTRGVRDADLAHTPVWGLVRAAQAENPDRFTLVDLDDAPESAAQLLPAVATGEPELSVRAGKVSVPRLARVPVEEPADDPWAGEGTTLVTGGTGGLGALVAKHLAARGARRLVLTSRRGPDAPGATELVAELADLGATARVVACDVADRAAVADLLDGITDLTAVVHTAGVVADGTVGALTAERVDEVLRPKADAAWHLHELTQGRDLTAFVLYSSLAALLDNPGQGNYAAANLFLNALAERRRAEGLPATALTWGLWLGESGMGSVLDTAALHRIEASGMPGLTPEENLALLDAALTTTEPVLAPVRLDLTALRARQDGVPALLRVLAPTAARRAAGGAAQSGGDSLGARLAELPEADRDRVLLDLVRAHVAAVLGHGGGDAIEPKRAFSEIGFDSLAAVELRNRLTTATGLRLPATLVFDYPTPLALVGHLKDKALGDRAAAAPVQRATATAVDDEPIAVVGMSCRFPGGVTTPEELWRLVADGVDGISRFPDDRGWDVDSLYDPEPGKPGRTYSVEGGFLDDALDFDAEFFGISPREATAMDPQQRLLLETAWEALERAGIDPTSLKGSPTGVFAGIMYHDYALRLKDIPEDLAGYLGNGSLASVASGRVAYVLGLEGPAVSVDTACSSSLVSIHLAAQALRGGECSLALAGGVTVMATPDTFLDFSLQRGLAADGRSKSFSADADGTAWGEGVGVLVLERLSDARRNGHEVLAVVKGSAINQDGASNGLTAPNGPSQQRVIRAALSMAGLSHTEVDAVEAHGTGTRLGDPIEAQALLATYGQDRTEPLWLGSIKSNVGHTQAAAGVAGVIKMVMAMREGVLPRTLHVGERTPQVDWSEGAVELLTEARPWPETGRPRRAGVSSFGISGTNAHVVLEQAPAAEPAALDPAAPDATEPQPSGLVPWALSARTGDALREQAARLREHVGSASPRDVGWSLATTRAALERRAVVVGEDADQLDAALSALASGEAAASVVDGEALSDPRVVFVFPGQGSQWAGMAVELLDSSPVFAERMRECAAALAPHVDWNLVDVVRDAPGAPPLNRVDVLQPVLWAITVSLAELWKHHGVRPDAVVGHSQGEIAAAVVSGALSLQDGAAIVALRSVLIGEELSGKSGMLSIQLPLDEVLPRLREGLTIGALNGARSVVVSGDPENLAALQAELTAEGVRARPVKIDYASHSPHVEVIRERLLAVIAHVAPRAATTPFCSTVTGGFLDGARLDADYWYSNLREKVDFVGATRALLGSGHTVFIECSPHPVLPSAVQETADEDDREVVTVPTLRREDGGPRRLLLSLAQAWTRGVDVDWTTLLTGPAAPRRVALPTYAFQHRRFWLDATDGPGDVSSAGLGATGHPLLGATTTTAENDGVLLTGRLALDTHPWLADHAASGVVLLPGTAFVELAVRAGDQVGCDRVDELTLEAPLVLPARGGTVLQVAVGAPDATGRRAVSVHSRPEDADSSWTRHASGFLDHAPRTSPERLTAWPPPGAAKLDVDALYAELAAGGYAYGPVFRAVRAAWRQGDVVFAEVALPEHADAAGFGLHPALLDAALHATGAREGGAEDGLIDLPFAWTGVTLHASGATGLRVRLTPEGGGAVSLLLADPTGAPVATVDALVTRPIPAEALTGGSGQDSLYRVDWTPVPAAGPVTGAVTVLDGPDLSALTQVPDWVVLPVSGQAARSTVDDVLSVLRQWIADERFAAARLALVTTGGVPAAGHAVDPVVAPVWGLVRAAQAENPDRFTLLDLDDANDVASAVTTPLGLGEPEVAVRDGALLVPRLARVTDRPQAPFAWTAEDTVLITGGTGGLGALLAGHLAGQGVRQLVLTSRRGPDAPGATELVAELADLGATARVVACDVADRDSVAALLADVDGLTAVVHTAGALADGLVSAMTPEQVDAVWLPKAEGARTLHELTSDLRAFVVFSSAAGVVDGTGQGNYAAANTYLDALVEQRRATGLPGTSIAWGLWEHRSGMTGHLTEGDLARMARSGVRGLPAAEGLALFDAALALDAPLLVPVKLDLAALRTRGEELPRLFHGLVRPTRRAATAAGADRTPRDELLGLSAEDRGRVLLDLVRSHVAAVLGHGSGAEIEPRRAFGELGFDSLAAVELRNRLTTATGLRLPATLVFDHPTPVALVAHLSESLGGAAPSAPTPVATTRADDGDPIAIVAMGCRYPGDVTTPEELWRLVADGVDAIGGFPVDRGWDTDGIYDPEPGKPGRTYVREGGFLSDALGFDAGFFGISPREALAMDPQQRLLLETAWEVIERAGIDPTSLKGTPTGVFAGVMYHDYGSRLKEVPEDLAGYLGNGSIASVLSGRVSYVLGLEGPAVSVDTACSSSLVSIHLAAQALRAGECSLALAGGVTVMSAPDTFVDFSLQRGLARNGRSKSFSADADGTGWGEGVGLLLLERLSDARRNGHEVLAVLRGSAVNQDGASNGLTAPNGPSQQRVIRAALANAGLSHTEVDAVEAHGTGTPLGDPIEAQALLATYGQDREIPLLLGSIKSNFGHTQAAAGVAGVIKMVMAMREGRVPATLHVSERTDQVDWSEGAVELLTEARPWPETGRPRRAGVSSFGISGTNAHIVLEQAPEPVAGTTAPETTAPETVAPEAIEPNGALLPLLVSGRGADAVRAQAGLLAAHLAAHPDLAPLDVAHSLVTTRAALEQRAVVVGEDLERLTAGLSALASGEAAASVVDGEVLSDPRVVFVFPGQGSQWVGMAAELLDASPVFAARMAECARALSEFVDWDLIAVARGDEDAPSLERVDVVQPVLWAMMVSLAELWRANGVRPDAVVGHSQGEIAAAVASGALSTRDGAAIVALRSLAIAEDLAGKGGMLSVQLPVDEVRPRLAEGLSIAVVNGARSVVVSGDPAGLDALQAELRAEGARAKRVPVDYASHSAHVESIRERLLDVLADLSPRTSATPFCSTVTAEFTDTAALDAGYWYTNLRETVDFVGATRTLLATGHAVFVECSPHAVLTSAVLETAEEDGREVAAIGSLRRDDGGPRRVLLSLAQAWTRGVDVDWTGLLADRATAAPKRIALPTYAFQHRRYWLDATSATGDVTSAGLAATAHPLLGATIAVAGADEVLLTGRLAADTHPWLAHHAFAGATLLPGTAFVELAIRAGDQVGCDRVDELTLEAPLALPERGGVHVQLRIGDPDRDGGRELTVHSRAEGSEAPWTRHATGRLVRSETTPDFDLVAWPPPGAQPVDLDGAYPALDAQGYGYGPAFQGLRAAWRLGDEVFAEVELPEDVDPAGYGLHPALLDAALHPVLVVESGEDRPPQLPFSWTGVSLFAEGARALRVRLTPTGGDGLAIRVADQAGNPVAQVADLLSREVVVPAAGVPDALFRVDWTKIEAAPTTGKLLVLGDALGKYVPKVPDLASIGADVPEWVVLPIGSAESSRSAVDLALSTAQEWLADDRFASSTLVVLTRGGAGVGDVPVDPAVTAVHGLIRAAAAENPDRFALVDTDGWPVHWDGLLAALGSGEPEIAVRGDDLLAPRLVRATPEGPAFAWTDQDTVLITGGTGGLGAVLARHLVQRGVRELVLTSRRGPDAPGAAELVAELADLGATARVVACDVADRDSVAALLAGVDGLTAVVHTAAVLDDGLVTGLTPERLDAAWNPKAEGARHLHELTGDLRAFVLFSSAAGVYDGAAQGNYAAANTYVDGLARARRDAGLPAVSLAWGFWSQRSGMTDHLSDVDLARMGRSGVTGLSTEEGLALFDASLASTEPLLVPMRLDLAALRERDALPALLKSLVRKQVRRSGVTGEEDGGSALARRLRALPPADRTRVVLDLVRSHVAAVLGHDGAASVDPRRAFRDLGFDSLAAVELRNRLVAATGLRLPATLVFDHPNPELLAALLETELVGDAEPAADLPAAPTRAVDDDPIAVVGIGCRFPGDVSTPEDLWRLLDGGVDAISAFPTDRGWDLDALFDPEPGKVGKSCSLEGGFLHDAADFDAGFFGISPREALATDPQQRLLLETAWEALERAGIDPVSLRGSATGVFAGVMYNDYATRLRSVPEDLAGYVGNGSLGSVASGRVSYVLGLEGPAVSVDTACSSSLVSLHLAAQALRAGECSLALAGGVSVMATPDTFIDFSLQRGLAPGGRAKSFSADADGTAMSEGVGMLVLERLSDARANGHEVLAVLRGSAVNQDGASNGLTAPNGPSQQRVMRSALAVAGLRPSEVDAVEAHGTGTVLGDPIEAQAVIATYGQDRDEPLWLGSIKSNIGHTQAAAGVAGVIKMIMAIRAGVLPRTLHADQRTDRVDWSGGAVELLTEPRPWPETDHPRRAGVSSFGISGTNAHVIVEQAPTAPTTSAQDAPTRAVPAPIVLAAADEGALRAQAENLLALLADGVDRTDLAHATATTRAALEHRAAIVPGDPAEVLKSLEALAATGSGPGVVRTARSTGALALLFTGQGAQRAGMGRELRAAWPVFAEAFDEACALLDAELDTPLAQVLDGDDPDLVQQTRYSQPALFAFEVALHRLLRSWGVRADLLAGHSIGELAAAHVAGVFSLADAARLVAARGRLMQSMRPDGGMVSVLATEERVRADLVGLEGRVDVAAVNGPASTVVSGDADALAELVATWKAEGLKTRALAVSHAFHSPHTDEVLDAFREVATSIAYAEPTTPVVSTLTGRLAEPGELTDPEYWVRHVRGAVRFHDAVRELEARGATTFLEVGPDAVLTALGRDCLLDEGAALLTATQRADHPETTALAAAVGALFVRGTTPDWAALFAGSGARPVDLPTYPFQRRRYWLDAAVGGTGSGSGHPLAGDVLTTAEGDGVLLTGRISPRTHAWLADHTVSGEVLLPGTAFVELAVQAGDQVGCGRVEELTLQSPLVLPERGGVVLQVAVGGPDESGRRTVTAHSRPDAEGAQWTRHATGSLVPDTEVATTDADLTGEPGRWAPPDATELDLTGHYAELAARGYGYGPAFQGLRAAWRRGDEVFAEVALPEEVDASGYGLHPALLDATLHTAELLEDGPGELTVPFAWKDVVLRATGASALRVRLTRTGPTAYSVALADPDGAPVAEVGSLAVRPLPAAEGPSVGDALFRLDWTPVLGAADTPARLAVLGAPGRFPAEVAYPDLDAVAAAGPQGPDSVLLPLPATGDDPAAAGRAAVEGLLPVLRRWAEDDRLAGKRLVVVTTGAVSVDGEDSPGLAHAALWGLLRSAQVEHPDLVGLVDVDGDPASDLVLPAALTAGEPQLAVRGGRAFAPRLVRAGLPAAAPDFGSGRVLVTGGLSGVGATVARHLVTARGVTDLLLTSRRGQDAPGAAELVAELTGLGASVEVAACDVADRDAVAALLEGLELSAVVHSAGVVDDALLSGLTPEQVAAVWRPKAEAAWHLHELTRGHDLTAFVLFSSLVSVVGGAGQSAYAAANGFLDALAAHRRAQGLPATSVAWGLWTGVGSAMTGELGERDLRRMASSGVLGLRPAEGLALLDAAVASDRADLVAARLDLAAVRQASGAVPPVFRALVRGAVRRVAGTGAPTSGPSVAEQVAALPPARRRDHLVELVRGLVAGVLGHDGAHAVDAGKGFLELGFDSLAAVELRNRVAEVVGVRLSATLVYDHPTPAAVAELLLSELGGAEESAPSLEAELARLETALETAAPDEEERVRVESRLRALVARWSGAGGAVAEAADVLDAVTADELFDILDEELEATD
ncbi:type I polyketide synthase [Actinosynnema pretiosum]|uniref:6-deoxyerythronolide-B synthase n=2 Tax=Actinosynnema pretiosum TaxID=42197 RepID=A0A4Y6AAU5_9PSEU|nr:type I polyketide synthase [Actinosynnema pretiosum]ATE54206.1 beta-ketoacyl synthase [Actinosynnema pretiosum]QDE53679.1 phosphopantetheine-binding domain-containing protein [Actinosynnema pretiosum subsp. pretiosum]